MSALEKGVQCVRDVCVCVCVWLSYNPMTLTLDVRACVLMATP